MNNNKPVFFHSMWRTSSTYFFSLFRESGDYLSFFEPFHEKLADLNMALDTPEEKSHPSLKRHYFYEYKLVCENNTVKHFDPCFSYLQRLSPDFNIKCKSYINNLITTANEQNLTPFLQFNRSFTCLDFFAEHYDEAINIYLYRNPRHQFLSYLHAGRNYYLGLTFLQLTTEIHRRNHDLINTYFIPFYYSKTSFQQTAAFYSNFVKLSPAACYYIFFTLWVIALSDAVRLGLPIASVDKESLDSETPIGIFDMFKKYFSTMNLVDYRPRYYDIDRNMSSLFHEVERAVFKRLDDSVYGIQIDAIKQCLKSSTANWVDKSLENDKLDLHLSEELIFVVDSLFATLGNGIMPVKSNK